MSLNPDWSTRFRKWTPSPVEGVAVEVVLGVAAVEVAVVEVAGAANSNSNSSSSRVGGNNKMLPDTEALSIRICQLASGQDALTISNSGKMHTFVLNQQHVLGKMCSNQDLPNENLTSSVRTKFRLP